MARLRSSLRVALWGAGIAIVFPACGPDLLQRADSTVTGSWSLTGAVPNLSQIRVDMIQDESGSVDGTWTGITQSGVFGCDKSTCNVGGAVSGVNTVLQVYLEIVGAGDFTGQLVSPNYLRGSIATPDPVAVELRK